MRFVLLFLLLSTRLSAQHVYEVKNGDVQFYSDAPQEIIKAYSANLKGLVDFSKKTFVFRIGISSFEGFNSPLQREHFNENYMETTLFPTASFTGKIIEDIDINKNGIYNVRTKGKLKIHGIEHERIIRTTVTVKDGQATIKSDFVVLLADHNIKVPRVVDNKLSQEIHVSVVANIASQK